MCWNTMRLSLSIVGLLFYKARRSPKENNGWELGTIVTRLVSTSFVSSKAFKHPSLQLYDGVTVPSTQVTIRHSSRYKGWRAHSTMEASHGTGVVEALIITKSKPDVVRPTMETYDGLYYLSPIDEFLMCPIHILFCFQMDGTQRTENPSEIIKQALAKALVHFYPFVGRLVQYPDGKFMVHCTGEGVSFVEAVGNCDLRDLGDFTVPNLAIHRQLVHVCSESKNLLDMPLLTVQVTRFHCGGFVIGLAINHCMSDGVSIMEFMESWAEIARGSCLTLLPSLDRSLLKPRQPFKIEYNHDNISTLSRNDSTLIPSLPQDENSVFKSFAFDVGKLMQLRKIAMEDGTIKFASDFVLIMAIVWRARSKALKMEPSKPSKLLIAVDGRHRMGQSFPKRYFGNATLLTNCECSAGELYENPLSFAVDLINRALKLDHIQSAPNIYLEHIQSMKDNMEAIVRTLLLDGAFVGNQWSRFFSYDIDFGWGSLHQIANACPQREVVVVHAQRKDSKNKILTLGFLPSEMKAFEEIMQSEMGIKPYI